MPFRMMAVLAVVVALTALHCTSSGKGEDTNTPAPALPTSLAEAAPPSATPEILGTWRMIEEEPADGLGGFFKQERRIFVFSKDKSFEVENFVSKLGGKFQLEGSNLTLSFQDSSQKVDVVSLSESELVLIEDLPEIYLRDGPPRRVQNRYRRVSDAAFGPIVGEAVPTSDAGPGEFSASYDFAMSKLPTMEITTDRDVSGRARLRLASDGSAEACFAVHVSQRHSESKYSSSDGQHHSSEEHNYWLAGHRGSWQSKDGKLVVQMERSWLGGCNTSTGPGDITGPFHLECVSLAANNKLPVPTLACQLIDGPGLLKEISINPADTERAGPYTMQSNPGSHFSTDPGKPWLFLAAKGLAVDSEDGRRSASPTLGFSSPALPLVEDQFIERK